jgi:ankyrin repeat protein
MLEADTPLIDAVRNGRVGVVVAMLADGAYDVNVPAKDGSGWTPLHVAVEKRHLSIVTKLLEANAGDGHKYTH